MVNNFFPYFALFLAVVFGTASNSYANNANGFTKIMCMYFLSLAMKYLPVGVTYASFAGLCIIATTVVGFLWFDQIPNKINVLGLLFIVFGVVTVNIFSDNQM